MKKIITLIILVSVIQLNAQDSKFFLGTGAGYTLALGDYQKDASDGGFALQAAKLGYRFTPNFGVVSEFYWSTQNIKDLNVDANIRHFSFGPMYSTSLGGQFSLDVKPQLLFGYVASTKYKMDVADEKKSDLDFIGNLGLLFGTSVNFGDPNGFQVSLNIDYAYAKVEETKINDIKVKLPKEDQTDVSMLTFGLGARFNF